MKIEHEWNVHLEIFIRPQEKENSRQYLLLRTDILQKEVVGCTCYHPVSIIPVIAKVFERIVDNQGYNYLRWRRIRYIAVNLGFEVFILLTSP